MWWSVCCDELWITVACFQGRSRLPAMRATCDSSSATTWTDTRECTAERSHTSAIAVTRWVWESAPDASHADALVFGTEPKPRFSPLQNFSRTDRLLRHRRLCTVGVTKEESQFSQETSAHPASWSPLQPSNNRLTV